MENCVVFLFFLLNPLHFVFIISVSLLRRSRLYRRVVYFAPFRYLNKLVHLSFFYQISILCSQLIFLTLNGPKLIPYPTVQLLKLVKKFKWFDYHISYNNKNNFSSIVTGSDLSIFNPLVYL